MVSYEAILLSKDMQPAAFQEDTFWGLAVLRGYFLAFQSEGGSSQSIWLGTDLTRSWRGRVIEHEQGGWRGWPSEEPGAKTKLSQQSLH